MISLEKVKLGTEVYDLVPAGSSFMEEKARLVVVLPEGKSYEDVERDMTGKDRIEILDSTGEILTVHHGYVYLDTLMKKKDYFVATEQVETGRNEENELIYENKEVLATVMVATLKKADLRQEMDKVKAIVDYVAMMAEIDLEV